jgi:dienelactone hydrolase
VALSAVLLAGCSSHDVATLPTCAEVDCAGVLNGAAYEIVLPQNWNGTLLLYSHGYRSAYPTPPEFEPVDSSAEPAPGWASGNKSVGEKLLSQGYALAGSAYAANGWAVTEGVTAGQDLIAFFTENFAEPKSVLAWGDSLGGLITANLAEIPDLLDGAAPFCGVLAGPNLNFDLAVDVTLAAKLTVLPELPLDLPGGYEDSVRALEPSLRTLLEIAEDEKDPRAGVLLAIGAMAEAPDQTRTFDGATPSSRLSAVIEGIVTAITFGTLARFEFDQRVGGSAAASDPTTFLDRIDQGELAQIEREFPGTAQAIESAWSTGAPVEADPAARAAAVELGTPSGEIQVPVLSIHTAADPLVIVANQTVFSEVVTATGSNELLVTGITVAPSTYPQDPGAPYGAGHCNFTDETRVGAIQALSEWVETGAAPTAEGLAADLGAGSGFDPTFTLPLWPLQP